MVEIAQAVDSVVTIQAGASKQLLVADHKTSRLAGVAIYAAGNNFTLDIILVAADAGENQSLEVEHMPVQCERGAGGVVKVGSFQERWDPGLEGMTVLAIIAEKAQVDIRFVMAAYAFPRGICKRVSCLCGNSHPLSVFTMTGRTTGRGMPAFQREPGSIVVKASQTIYTIMTIQTTLAKFTDMALNVFGLMTGMTVPAGLRV